MRHEKHDKKFPNRVFNRDLLCVPKAYMIVRLNHASLELLAGSSVVFVASIG